ncbi:hypothetical protein M0R72_05860 [Candidatus Pacearchaeota archaeon]|jgi:hypothetical protein|nr:hypothetical protein [Candidatus Pacearchaeota archaeon]
MAQELIEKTLPRGKELRLTLKSSIRAGPWSEPDHEYVAPCGCAYQQRAHGRGEGWGYICPDHRGAIQYIDSEEAREVLPYRCSSEEYLRKNTSGAFLAFLAGRDYRPDTYEYGSNAGDYSSPLVSENGELWYYNVRQSCPTKRAIIAKREVI